MTSVRQAKVEQRYRCDVHSIEKTDSGFKMHLNTDEVECDSLVVATGGLSMPKLGATPFGYKIAEQFGLSVMPTTAGLVPFTLHKEDKEAFAELFWYRNSCRDHRARRNLVQRSTAVYPPRPIGSFSAANFFVLESGSVGFD